tara:strand:+ start:2616 stop:3029 length:414 start_codon:yes stop_codon:yes gene_type:complete
MKIFPSKIGLELVIPIGLLFLGISYKMYLDEIWLGLVVMFLTSIFLGYLFTSMKYGIDTSDLHIYGCFGTHKKIPIKNIIKITETNNPISSAAASMDRLEIHYNKYDSVLISPKDKKEFLTRLLKQNAKINIIYKKR